MTKNEIVARWLNKKVRILGYELLHEAWVKFRDLQFESLTDEFYGHAEMIHEIAYAITYKSINEAFDELVKGIKWYNSLKK